MNLPDSPGLEVTSTWPTPISRSSVHPEKSSQMGWSARQAGHHGAMNSTIHSPARISLQLSSDIVVNLDSTRGLTARATIRITTRIVILIPNVADTKATSSVGFTVFLPVLC